MRGKNVYRPPIRREELPENPDGTLLAVVQDMAKTMLRWTPRQRAVLADKVPDMANIVAGAIVIGFAIGDPEAPWPALVIGIAIWAGALIFAVSVAEE